MQRYHCVDTQFLFKLRNYIINLNHHDQKIRQTQRATYGTTGHDLCWKGIYHTPSQSCRVSIYTVSTALYLTLLWVSWPMTLICCWFWLQRALSSKGRLEAERSPSSAGPPSGGQTASLTPLSPLYSTEPCCPV